MKNLVVTRIQNMNPYTPPLIGRSSYNGLLLDSNERTTVPSGKVITAITKLLGTRQVQTYPEYGDLEAKIARYAGVDTNQVLLTSGSDQAISLIFRTFTDVNDSVIIPSPTFSMYGITAQICGGIIDRPSYSGTPLRFPTDEILTRITPQVRLIVICNPNNPTGTLAAVSDIKQIAKKANNSIILVDEAYAEFSGISCVKLIKTIPNLIITRTFSKAFGLAGARIGYIIADPTYVSELRKIRGPYDVNIFAAVVASAALKDIPDMRRYVALVMNRSKPLLENFFSTNKIPFCPSAANFLLFYPDNATRVEMILRENGILVRQFNSQGLENALRVTIGTINETNQFINIYTRYVLDTSQQQSYAFIDRDGTLMYEPQDTFQVDSVKDLRILPGVIRGLKKLKTYGYRLIMISNQDGLGSTKNPAESFMKVQKALLTRLRRNGITFEKILICPHFPEDQCACRKPKTGLIKTMLSQKKVNLATSFVCGDRISDKLFADNMGISYRAMKTNGDFLESIGFPKEAV